MTRRNYEIGTAFTGTGTASTAGDAVTGVGTAFTTEFAAGYLIQLSDQWRVVESVADDTHLTVTNAFAPDVVAQPVTGVNLKNVELLTTPVTPPKGLYEPWTTTIPLGSGLTRGAGFPKATWHYDFLRQSHRDQLRLFCTGKSAAVYIRTTVNDAQDEFRYFSAVMNWPDREERQFTRRMNIDFEMRELVELDIG